MKQLFLICSALIIFSKLSFGQTYYEQHAKCSEILKDIPIGDSIFWAKLAARDSCLIGLKTPFFEATTLENEKFNIDSLTGKVVFLNFWFTRCKPCIEEMPLLNKIVSEYKKEDIVFLSFANEDSVILKNFLQSTKFDFKVTPNGGRILIDTFKLFSIWPTNVIIDKQGKIRCIQIGQSRDNYKNILEELLK
jgi:thiol-disulfide isomerase/thioredoxin